MHSTRDITAHSISLNSLEHYIKYIKLKFGTISMWRIILLFIPRYLFKICHVVHKWHKGGAEVRNWPVITGHRNHTVSPENRRQRPNAGLLLVHRLRRSLSIKPALRSHRRDEWTCHHLHYLDLITCLPPPSGLLSWRRTARVFSDHPPLDTRRYCSVESTSLSLT